MCTHPERPASIRRVGSSSLTLPEVAHLLDMMYSPLHTGFPRHMGPCCWRLVAGRRYVAGPSTVRGEHPPVSCTFCMCTSLVLRNTMKSRNVGTNLLIPYKNDLCLLATLLFYSIFFG